MVSLRKNFICVILIILGFLSVAYAADIHQIDPAETEAFNGANHNPCAHIKNNGSNTYFVGAKTDTEWQSFYNAVGVTLTDLQNLGTCP